MTHTPGPWTVGEHRGVWVGPVVKAGRTGVAFIVGERAANASLIAAAPDMLDALRAVKSEFIDMYEECYPNDESDNDVTAAIDMVIAAIAKAEGRDDDQSDTPTDR